MKKRYLMYLIKIITIAFVCIFYTNSILGQDVDKNLIEFELGLATAGSEALYYGVYSKVNFPLSKAKNYFYGGFGLTVYADFVGEITSESKLENDIDLRIIPYVFLGYNFSVRRFDFALELPVGTSIAITKGKLVNTNVGFEREYSNTNFLLHNGLGISTKYKVTDKGKFGLYLFLPINNDDAWSPPMIGLSWIKEIASKN